jgi:hypothetical protein
VSYKGYKPSLWQQNYHDRLEDEVLGAGAAGPGKSVCLIHDHLMQVKVETDRASLPKSHPSYQEMGASVGWALYLRRTTPRLEHHIKVSHDIIPKVDPGAKWLAAKNTWIYSCGYRLQFGHCSEYDDWDQYMSFEFSALYFDELVEFEQEQYDQITTRVRSSDPIMRAMKRIRAMSNPVMKRQGNESIHVRDPFWVRKYFVDPWPEGNRILKKRLAYEDGREKYRTRLYLPATLDDNPDKAFVEDFKATLLGKPTHIQQALLYGNWYITEGAFYSSVWNNNLHVIKPFAIPSDWPKWRTMDWGFKQPGCVHWWAMDPDENIYCIRELTFQEKEDKDVAEEVKTVEKQLKVWGDDGSRLTGPADTQLWEQRGDSALSKAQVFANKGVPWTKANKKSREHNAERFYNRLRDKRGGVPGIMFFNTCKMAITTIPGIQTDPKNPNTPADGGPDHWHDSVLYSCAYASHGSSGVGGSYDDLDEWEREDKSDETDLGRDGYGSRV